MYNSSGTLKGSEKSHTLSGFQVSYLQNEEAEGPWRSFYCEWLSPITKWLSITKASILTARCRRQRGILKISSIGGLVRQSSPGLAFPPSPKSCLPAPDMSIYYPLLDHLPGVQQAAGPDPFHFPLSRRPGWVGSPTHPAKTVKALRAHFPMLGPGSPTNVSL